MATDFHQRIRQLFDQALERPESERLAFVKIASAGDSALSDAVERLLEARGASQSFLDETLDHTRQIGRYLIRGELGHGAMGIVYEAVDPMIGRRVAVKVISLKAGMDASQAEFMKERLFREARSAGRLFHPGIVVILDVGVHEDSAFITMELVDGPSLHQVLAAGLLDSKTALAILRQTAAALDFAHQHGVVHRDIKPANIMLQDRTTVKVADFGIAKLMSQNATLTGMLMGTPSYMSPEQIEAQPVDGRSDQFSLAVLAYELLTGTRPFQAESMATVAHLIVYGPRPSAHAAKPSLPGRVDEVLARGLSRFPDQRFPSCTEFTTALETALLQPAQAPDEAPPAAPKLRSPQKRSPLIYIGGLAAILIVAAALAAIYFRAFRPQAHLAKATAPPVVHAAVAPKPTPLGKSTPTAAVAAVVPKAAEPTPIAKAVPAESKPEPKPESKPAPQAKVPDSFRAQEFYNAAMAKRRENKPEEAVALFREAADLDDAKSMQELGECYRTGDGVAKDGLTAEQWFLKSVAAGSTSAMVSLGAMFWLGDDIPQSDDDALHWFQRAADAKNPAGLYDLARFYEQGRAVAKNVDKAKELYQQAAALGNAEAQRRLAQLQARK